jgi:hypothetical protein
MYDNKLRSQMGILKQSVTVSWPVLLEGKRIGCMETAPKNVFVPKVWERNNNSSFVSVRHGLNHELKKQSHDRIIMIQMPLTTLS